MHCKVGDFIVEGAHSFEKSPGEESPLQSKIRDPENLYHISKRLLGNGSSSESGSSIVHIFKPIITALSLAGFCPLTLLSGDKRGKASGGALQGKYVWNWKNPKTFICLVVGLLCCLQWTILLWVLGLGKPFFGYSLPQSSQFFNETGALVPESTSMSYIHQSSHFLLPSVMIMEVGFGWTQSWGLAKFLNSFAPLEDLAASMASTFGRSVSYQGGILAFRKTWTLFYLLLPTLATVALYVWRAAAMGSNAAGLIYSLVGCSHMMGAPLLGDMLVLMSYRVLAGFYSEARQIITALSSEDAGRLIYSVGPELRRVRKLILMVRKQVGLCCEWQWRRELMLICNSVVSITCTLYLTFAPDNNQWTEMVGMKLIYIGFVIYLVVRVYFKGVVAETISFEEAQLATEIINLTTREGFGDFVLEAKLTHDVMMLNPTKISLGNYLTLNKALLLKISYLVVTYLIVMAQFLHE